MRIAMSIDSSEDSKNPDHIDEKASSKKGGLWQRLKGGLTKTRTQLGEGVGNLLLGEKEIS